MHHIWGPVSLVLVLLGVVWYLYFGVSHSDWTDVGVYSVTAMLVGFGAAGYWASLHMNEDAADA